MSKTKSFPVVDILTMYTGRSFGTELPHAAIEHVFGHPVWTHEMAEKKLWTRLRVLVETQVPRLVAVPWPDTWNAVTVMECLAAARLILGDEVALAEGAEERAEGLLESPERLAPTKNILVKAGKKEPRP